MPHAPKNSALPNFLTQSEDYQTPVKQRRGTRFYLKQLLTTF